tara:strand:+ start:344 stop:1021 length:678 start_codon:yes stop_codon:yes gene_type:complete
MIATQTLWSPLPAPRLLVLNEGFVLSSWSEDESNVPPCSFYNASGRYSDGICSHLSISRLSSIIQEEAMQRAFQCASHFETECILSPEVGLAIPSAFVYDPQDGLRMIIAPKLWSLRDAPHKMKATNSSNETTLTLVDFQDPQENIHTRLHFHETIVAVSYTFLDYIGRCLHVVASLTNVTPNVSQEYLDGETREIVHSTLTGQSAYCLQMLRLAFDEDCWARID